MEIILTEDVPKLGNAGDVVRVKEGFGRNYLLPNKKGLVANSKNLKALEAQKKMIEAKKTKLKKTAEEISVRLNDSAISFEKEAGSGDRLFGSITKMDIVSALRKEGIELDKQILDLKTPIKTLGSHEVSVKLHPEVTATLKINISAKS